MSAIVQNERASEANASCNRVRRALQHLDVIKIKAVMIKISSPILPKMKMRLHGPSASSITADSEYIRGKTIRESGDEA